MDYNMDMKKPCRDDSAGLILLDKGKLRENFSPDKEKSPDSVWIQGFLVELLGRFELPTSSLPNRLPAF